MDAKTYTYEDPNTLNYLAMLIAENKCEFSATMMPNIPEFIQAANKNKGYTVSSSFSDIKEKLKENQNLEEVAHTLTMVKLCEQHNIIPFWMLNFDCSFNGEFNPKIKYIGYDFGCCASEEPYKSFQSPINFAKDSKWYAINFREIKKPDNILTSKYAISNFIEQDYIVTGISAELNPWIRSGEYFDYKESDATMYASDGSIVFYGDVPADFEDLNDLTKLKQNIKALPEPPKLLDRTVKSLLKLEDVIGPKDS